METEAQTVKYSFRITGSISGGGRGCLPRSTGWIQGRGLIIIIVTGLQTLFTLHQLSQQWPFSVSGSHTVFSYCASLVSSKLWRFLPLPLSFIQASCFFQNAPGSGFVWCFLLPRFGLCIWGNTVTNDGLSFSAGHTGGSLSSLCLIPGGISLNHLFKEVSAGFLLCKVVVFPFLVDKHLGGDAFRPCKCPVSPPTFTC